MNKQQIIKYTVLSIEKNYPIGEITRAFLQENGRKPSPKNCVRCIETALINEIAALSSEKQELLDKLKNSDCKEDKCAAVCLLNNLKNVAKKLVGYDHF